MTFSRAIASVALIFALSADALGTDSKSIPIAKLDGIKKAIIDAQTAYHKATSALPDTPEGDKQASQLFEEFDKKEAAAFLAALELATAEPKSDTSFDALEWILTAPRSYSQPVGKMALELVIRHHAANPKIGKIVAMANFIVRSDANPLSKKTATLFQEVLTSNPDHTACGQAAMAIASRSASKVWIAEYRRSPDLQTLALAAEKAFELVLKDYADCPSLLSSSKQTCGDKAQHALFQLRHLRVGKVAPDIEAEDLDGVRFKLTDYRGKVVVLVYWATWCGPCMAQVPHERKLVQRMKDRPFALVGVNIDKDREKAKQTTVKHKIDWRSFWNGPKGTNGPITETWNVGEVPTIYVLDHTGVIRFKGLFGKELDEAVDVLTQELANDKKAGK
jgi:peroxiredoxin